jgi:DNA-binding transcriptional MerR regulator
MAWSTRELAELAQTTVNTIRHYHHLGLLAEPERKPNGYKQYGVTHLLRLLQIRRLVELGVPLSQIRDEDIDGLSTQERLRQLDAELLASIHRLQQARSDIAASLCDEAHTDAPAGLESAASVLSGSTRSILHISGQICDKQAVSNMQYMVEVDASVGRAIDSLPPDADDATRERLAQLLAPILVQNLIRCPWLLKSTQHLSCSEGVTQQTISEAVTKLYNPAQLDVIGRAVLMVQDLLPAETESRCDAL